MRVAVVGGGIAGLSTAFHLQESARAAGIPLDCTIIEADGRLGGKVVTARENGYAVEGGPDSFLTQKPWGVELCRKLGIFDRLVAPNEASRRVWILWKGKLHKLPDGVLLIVPTRLQPFALSTLISPLGKLRMGLDLVIPARKDPSDESVADFVRRRLGNEALEKIAEPLMGGIHVSDPDRQSLQASFPRFADIERKYGSLVRGILAGRNSHSSSGSTRKPLPAFMTLRGGLGELIDTIERKLDATRVLTGQRVEALAKSGTGYVLSLDDGSRMEVDGVVLANSAMDAGKLLESIDPELSAKLHRIRYVSTATVSFGFRRDQISHPLKGFGFVIPRKEKRLITGCTWSSTKFDERAPEGRVLIRCFLGGATDERPALVSEEEMVGYARQELKSLMGITAEPDATWVFRWRNGHPQYDVGHLDLVADIERLTATHPGLRLAGSSYRGVGLPDCIRSGAAAAEGVLQSVASPVVGTLGTP